MSITIDYFFNSEKALPELGQQINGCLGCSLQPYKGNEADLYCRFFAMEFSFGRAEGYENDREFDFENFRFELGFRIPWPAADLGAIVLPTLLAVIYALHRRWGIVGMLVYDVQRLLARYEERTDAEGRRYLFDLVSGSAFDDFSRHLADVETRIANRH